MPVDALTLVYALGSSECANSFEKMLVKMLAHLHMMVYTWWRCTFAKEVEFERYQQDSALLINCNAYFLLSQRKVLGSCGSVF